MWPRLNHATPLITDMLQSGGNVDLFTAFGHAVQHHVNEDIGSRPTHSVTVKEKRQNTYQNGSDRIYDSGLNYLQWMQMGQDLPR